MDSTECHIEKLRDHLLVEIFLNLPHPCVYDGSEWDWEGKLLKGVGLVNRYWRELVFSPQLWRDFTICFHRRIHPGFFPFLYRIASHIHSLELSGNPALMPPFLLKFPSFPNVTNLAFFKYPKITPMELDLLVTLCPSVTGVMFTGCLNLRDRLLLLFASKWKNLVGMGIYDDPKVTPTGLIEFVSAANQLQTLNISEILNLTYSDFDVITGVLGKSIKSINFGRNQASLSGLAIRSISRNCPQLKRISIQKEMYIGYLKVDENVLINEFANTEGVQIRVNYCDILRT